MKNITAVILLALVVFGAVIPGCRQVPHYDERLTALDSLMRSNPDSVVTVLEALSPNSSPARGEVPVRAEEGELTSDYDRAYRDLLLTQARYKAYITATSDSDINRALAYFRAHPADREKLTRAYIYKGAVMDELGHPDSAMLYYKTAETTAAPDDYFNLGYSNLRIAQLYQYFLVNDSAVVQRMKKAASNFSAIGDTGYLITALGTQGAYSKIIGKDSAIAYLSRAIDLARELKSYKGLQYQSKLAGIYFYQGDYQQAKDLAMGIVRNHPEKCNEGQFYYYAALSFIQLGHIDSARWLTTIIPKPCCAVDSMNYFNILAELSMADKKYLDYKKYSEIATSIDNGILKASGNIGLSETELKWEAKQHIDEIIEEKNNNQAFIIGAIVLLVIIMGLVAASIVKKLIRRYNERLAELDISLANTKAELEENLKRYETEHHQLRLQLAEQKRKMATINKKNQELETQRLAISQQVSAIVRYRHAALNELYNGIRVKSNTIHDQKRSISLMGLIREIGSRKKISQVQLSESFWDNLRISVDKEFEGIMTFVEQKYPHLTVRERHLFCLLCAGISNQIIKLCMNYYHEVTVSKCKKKLFSERIGMDVKCDEFIELYLQGKIE